MTSAKDEDARATWLEGLGSSLSRRWKETVKQRRLECREEDQIGQFGKLIQEQPFKGRQRP